MPTDLVAAQRMLRISGVKKMCSVYLASLKITMGYDDTMESEEPGALGAMVSAGVRQLQNLR